VLIFTEPFGEPSAIAAHSTGYDGSSGITGKPMHRRFSHTGRSGAGRRGLRSSDRDHREALEALKVIEGRA
jgi:hypothetical protein